MEGSAPALKRRVATLVDPLSAAKKRAVLPFSYISCHQYNIFVEINHM